MGKIIRNTLILTIITVVAGLGLGLVYEVTKEPIARTEEQAKKEAWQTVFSDVSLEDFKAVDVDKEAADKTVADLGIKATVEKTVPSAAFPFFPSVRLPDLECVLQKRSSRNSMLERIPINSMYPRTAAKVSLLMLSVVRPSHPELLPVQAIQLSAIAKTHFRRVVEYE